MVEFSKQPIACKIIQQPTTDNIAISEVDAIMCIVLSKAEKHVQYEEPAGTTECITL